MGGAGYQTPTDKAIRPTHFKCVVYRNSTNPAYSIILYCPLNCLYYITVPFICQHLFRNFLKTF